MNALKFKSVNSYKGPSKGDFCVTEERRSGFPPKLIQFYLTTRIIFIIAIVLLEIGLFL
jgi:hypothetical protein